MRKFINRIFGNKLRAQSDVQTAPLSDVQLKTVSKEAPRLDPPQLIVGVGQSVGKQRDHNEDTLFSFNTILAGEDDQQPFGLFIVADGMGGHQHGEIASQTAVKSMSNYLIRKLYLPTLSLKSEVLNEPLHEIIEAGITEAQEAVAKSAPGGGTTLTTALVFGEQLVLAHVGDSRAYFIHPDGRMNPITRDHSLVRRLLELGQISEKEALTHPQRNVLYRAIGQSEPYTADINTHLLPHPGYLLLCSDGLWGVVNEQEIFRLISSSATPSLACKALIDAANEAGGPDNISVILVHYPS